MRGLRLFAIECLALISVTGLLPAQAPSSAVAPAPRIASVVHTPAQLESSPLERRLDLSLTGMGLQEALDEIARRASLPLSYSPEMLPAGRLVSLRAQAMRAGDALDELLRDTGLELSISPTGQIAILRRPRLQPGAEVQVATISGSVTNESTGEPLSGASVVVVGTAFSTMTAENGRYAISGVPAGSHQVRVQRLGFAPKTSAVQVVAGQTAVIDFALTPQAVELEGIVAVGYGTQRVENLTGSVASVNLEEIEGRPITDLSQALAGAAPGLQVTQNVGQPGRDDAQIRIRGVGTLNNSSPLVLVDGIEGSLSSVAPNDVASISVLKDAASAAIYGSRAANGVILITTKKGQPTGGVRLSYDGYYGLQQPTRLMDLVVDMPTHMRLMNQAKANLGFAPQFPAEEIAAYESATDPLLYPNTDWFDWAFGEPTPITEHHLSASGGAGDLTYFLSLGLLDQQGLIDVTSKRRYNLRLNSQADLSDRVRLGTNLYGYWQEVTGDYDVMSIFLDQASTPGVVPRAADGRYGGPQAEGEGFVGNPASTFDSRDDRSTRQLFSGKVYTEIDLLDNLTFQTNGGLRFENARHSVLDEPVQLWNFREDVISRGEKEVITLSESDGTDRSLTWYSTLTYDQELGDHAFTLLGGHSVETFKSDDFSARIQDIFSPATPVLSAGSDQPTNGGAMSEWALQSFFGRANYNILGRYLFEANARYDGSSRFRNGNRWGFFPSFSAGWRISEEPFFPQDGIINELKIRGSWGELGNQLIGTYPYQSVYELDGLFYNLNGAVVPGAAQTALANSDIRWETTTSTDVGIDLSMLDYRLSATFDYFYKLTDDILVQLPIPDYLGAKTAPYQNIGKVRNKGWEATVGYEGDLEAIGLGFDLGFNLTHVDNLVETYKGETPSISGAFIIQEGLPFNSLYGYKVEGIFQSEEEIAGAAVQDANMTAPGDLRYADLDGDGVITPEDRTVIGNAIPKYTYGVNMGLNFKGFDVSALFQGVHDVDRYLDDRMVHPFARHDRGLTPTFWKDAWTPENRDTNIPRLVIPSEFGWNYRTSEYWMQDASFLRLKNAQIGYSLPTGVSDRLGVSRARIYLNGYNLLTFTDYLGFDPERSDRGTEFAYPQVRSYSVGLQVGF